MTDEPSIPPALTAEEWGRYLTEGVPWPKRISGPLDFVDCDYDRNPAIEAADLPKVAALCLYGQPFGFTHEEIDAMDHALGMAIEYAEERSGLLPDWPKERALIEGVMAKLAALLPPT